jgi:hypothetical protein
LYDDIQVISVSHFNLIGVGFAIFVFFMISWMHNHHFALVRHSVTAAINLLVGIQHDETSSSAFVRMMLGFPQLTEVDLLGLIYR